MEWLFAVYWEIDELHLLFLPLKPWLTRGGRALRTADLCSPHGPRAGWAGGPVSQAMAGPLFMQGGWTRGSCWMLRRDFSENCASLPPLVSRRRPRGSLWRAARADPLRHGSLPLCIPSSCSSSSSLDIISSFLSKLFPFLFLLKAGLVGTFKAGSHYFLQIRAIYLFFFSAKIKLSLCCEVCCETSCLVVVVCLFVLVENILTENSWIDVVASTAFILWLFAHCAEL